jgi:hypothetical protein
MMKSLILLFLTVFFAICIKAASPSYNNFDTNSFLISGVTNGIPYVAVPIISVKNGGSGGATYSFYNTNLPAGFLVTNAATVGIGTNAPSASATNGATYSFYNTNLPAGFLVTNAATVGIGTNAPSASATNVMADKIDNSTGHAYTAPNPANQFTGTFNGNAATATTATNGYASTNRVYWQAYTQTNVFWGDSLTAGDEDGLGDSYPLFLTLYSGVQNLNFGIGGAGSYTILTNFTSTFHTNLWSQPTFIWSGNNDVGNGAAAVETNLLTMALDLQSVGNTNYWFLTLINNTNQTPPTETALLTCNAWLKTTFTNHVIDVRSWIQGHPDPTSLVDSNAVYQGFAPASLRYDVIHFNTIGYSLVADYVNQMTMASPSNVVTEARLRDVLSAPPALGVGIPLSAYSLNISNNVNMGTAPLYFGANTYLQQSFDGSLQIISGEPQIYMHGISLGASGSALGGIYMTGPLQMSANSQIQMGNSTHGFNISGDGNVQIQSGTGGTVYASGLNLGAAGANFLNGVYSKTYFIGTNGIITIAGDGNITINTMTASGIIYVNGKDIGASGYRGGTAYFTNFNDQYGLLPASTNIATIAYAANASNLTSGTVADARLSGDVQFTNSAVVTNGVSAAHQVPQTLDASGKNGWTNAPSISLANATGLPVAQVNFGNLVITTNTVFTNTIVGYYNIAVSNVNFRVWFTATNY